MSTAVGIDLVQVSRVEASLARFGDRFLRRVFTEGEIAYARAAPNATAERLAARFAAKEATIKALDLAERNVGIGWRQIEVLREDSGKCRLILHGAARVAADDAGVAELSLSMTHEGDYSAAVVLALSEARNNETHRKKGQETTGA
jgi:holo-[acyl-carrier protein] synthase